MRLRQRSTRGSATEDRSRLCRRRTHPTCTETSGVKQAKQSRIRRAWTAYHPSTASLAAINRQLSRPACGIRAHALTVDRFY